MPAILFGSISTLADTSELQREAFNQAFRTHGLGWEWGREHYREMLATSGGQARIAEYAESRGESVDARAVHETKSAVFQESLSAAVLEPRPGVVDTIEEAKSRQWRIGLVTTTSRENVAALLGALQPHVGAADFDVIVDATSVERSKPDAEAYEFALQALGQTAGDAVAIEDNVDGVRAAVAAGVPCVAFPNANTARHDFTAATRSVGQLDAHELLELTHAR